MRRLGLPVAVDDGTEADNLRIMVHECGGRDTLFVEGPDRGESAFVVPDELAAALSRLESATVAEFWCTAKEARQ